MSEDCHGCNWCGRFDCRNNDCRQRKLTLEITIDPTTGDADWLWDVAKNNAPINGVRVRSISNDWLSDELKDALINTHNFFVNKTNEEFE